MSVKNYNPIIAWFKLPLWKKILIALILGIVTGLIAGKHVVALEFLGTMFIHAIQMLVVPVVFTAIVCAVISIDNLRKMRRIITKALVLYFLCMIVAASLGIAFAYLLKPGVDFHMNIGNTQMHLHAMPTLGQILVSFIPSSPVLAFSKNNVIQILVFAAILGVAIKLVGKKAEPVERLFESLSSVVFKFAEIVVSFAPYGIFGLIAFVFGKYGINALLPLFKFVITVYLACLAQCILVYGVFLVINGINPIRFFKKITSAIILSYTTSSSAATLPVSMRCAQENLKIDRSLSSFLLPFGATFNLNGLSIYLSVATVFAANLYGIPLHFPQYFTIVITIVFTAIGAAAVPGSALIVMSAVMTSVGVPLGALPLIAGVDRFNDMAQTATNVIGDLFATTLVAKNEAKPELEEITSEPVNSDL